MTAKDTDIFWNMVVREDWVFAAYRLHDPAGPITKEFNLHNNLDFCMKCINGTFSSNLERLLKHDFLTSQVYPVKIEKMLLSKEGLVCPARYVDVPERYEDPSGLWPGQRLCAGARLRLIKLGDKWGLSVSSYGKVKAGDLVVVY